MIGISLRFLSRIRVRVLFSLSLISLSKVLEWNIMEMWSLMRFICLYDSIKCFDLFYIVVSKYQLGMDRLLSSLWTVSCARHGPWNLVGPLSPYGLQGHSLGFSEHYYKKSIHEKAWFVLELLMYYCSRWNLIIYIIDNIRILYDKSVHMAWIYITNAKWSHECFFMWDYA